MKFKDCEITARDNRIKVSNSLISREWVIKNGLCHATSVYDLGIDKEYLAKVSDSPAPSPDFTVEPDCREVKYSIYKASESIVEEESFRLDVISDYGRYTVMTHFKIYPYTAAVSQWISVSGHIPTDTGQFNSEEPIDNIEDLRMMVDNHSELTGLCDAIELDIVHKKLGITEFSAHTDRKDNLCHYKEDLLTIYSIGSYSSNLFYYYDLITDCGLVFLKEAPLPQARPVKNGFDLIRDGGSMYFTGHGSDDLAEYPGYPFTVIAYSGGDFGRIKSLQDYQRRFRIYDEKRDNVIWHSTWGDRNLDRVVSEEFMLKELEDMREAGGDFLYLSDGWHKGASYSGMTMERYINQWNKPGFWEVDRDKFPDDLHPLLIKAESYGMMKGMWYCPDQTDDYANYEKDIDLLLRMHREYGINKVKFDAITFRTKLAEKRIKGIMKAYVDGTNGDAFVEIDITAGIRPDYFDCMQYGFLFLENRYTDWRKWYPHCTLRNLWQLSRFVDPRRLRIEILNNERNKDQYPDDPLAPCNFTPEWLYVSTIFANPLLWFEISNLSDEYKKSLKEIIKLCRPIRKEIAQSNVYPIGDEPDGFSISGFMSVDEFGGGYALVLRAAGSVGESTFPVPIETGNYEFVLILGEGEDFCCNITKCMTYNLPVEYSYLLYKFSKV